MQQYNVMPNMGFDITEVIHHDNFISEYKTNLDCSKIIEYFEFMSQNGMIVKRNTAKAKDDQIFVHELPHEEYVHDSLTRPVYQIWNGICMRALEEYSNKYDILRQRRYQHNLCKMQKTRPSGGFHLWHYENTPNNPFRQLVSMLYLNDNFDGGETEFLYQQCRIKPEAGKFVIFPGGWTHTHRGNPPLSGEKYIMTSWVEEYPGWGE